MSKAVSFMEDDDDSDEATIKKAPVVARPPVAQPVAAAEPVRESVASSRASENIRETVPAPPAPKQESPKEEKKKSIAELAALINPAALGGGPRPGTKAPPQVTRSTNVTRQTDTAGGVTFDG